MVSQHLVIGLGPWRTASESRPGMACWSKFVWQLDFCQNYIMEHVNDPEHTSKYNPIAEKKKKSQSRDLLLCQGIKRAVHKQMACHKKRVHPQERNRQGLSLHYNYLNLWLLKMNHGVKLFPHCFSILVQVCDMV